MLPADDCCCLHHPEHPAQPGHHGGGVLRGCLPSAPLCHSVHVAACAPGHRPDVGDWCSYGASRSLHTFSHRAAEFLPVPCFLRPGQSVPQHLQRGQARRHKHHLTSHRVAHAPLHLLQHLVRRKVSQQGRQESAQHCRAAWLPGAAVHDGVCSAHYAEGLHAALP